MRKKIDTVRRQETLSNIRFSLLPYEQTCDKLVKRTEMSSNTITSHSTRETIHLKKQFDEIIMKKRHFFAFLLKLECSGKANRRRVFLQRLYEVSQSERHRAREKRDKYLALLILKSENSSILVRVGYSKLHKLHEPRTQRGKSSQTHCF